MKKTRIHTLLPGLAIALLAGGCEDLPTYPDEPLITFKKVYVVSDTVDILDNPSKYLKLTFNVIDGDGNIGFDSLYVGDSLYTTNIFTEIYARNDTGFYRLNLPATNYKIPYIETPASSNKTIDADVTIEAFYQQFPYDTIKWKIYVIDRDLNESNRLLTPEIIFD